MPIYHRQFWNFIKALEESGYASGYLEGEPSVLAKALNVSVRDWNEVVTPKRQIRFLKRNMPDSLVYLLYVGNGIVI